MVNITTGQMERKSQVARQTSLLESAVLDLVLLQKAGIFHHCGILPEPKAILLHVPDLWIATKDGDC